MMVILQKLKINFYDLLTLKRRIFIIFICSTLIPFLFVVLMSYNTIYLVVNNKIEEGIQRNIKQVELAFENALSNLNHVSQLLAFEGTIGKKLNTLLTSDEPYERSQLTSQLMSELNVITFTNPNVGLTLYYYKNEGNYMFENLPVRNDFVPENSPVLAEHYKTTYYGPHISNYRYDKQHVLSILRKVDLTNRDDVYVYVESGFKLTQNILDNGLDEKNNASYLFLDTNGNIAYSEIPEVFKTNSKFSDQFNDKDNGSFNGYFWFKQTSSQGWSVISVISKADYNKEINSWFYQMLIFSLLLLAVSLFLAWLLWKMVYRPLNIFNKEIRSMINSNYQPKSTRRSIPEFDYVLNQFRQMRERIWELFSEVQQKEKRRADLEVEKLLYQINPHFLMNTLNSVHWLAVMNGQHEIDRLVLSLSKLLYYNLGKLGQATTIREEIDALKQYLVLQQIRYDFEFKVQIEVDEAVLNTPIPRFILQPIVENSLYHGFSDDGYIQVNVRLDKDIKISIRDNGSGISEEDIEQLLNNEQEQHKKVGMGIGMNYVKRMIEAQYEGKAELKIESEKGKGTSIYLTLPVLQVVAEKLIK